METSIVALLLEDYPADALFFIELLQTSHQEWLVTHVTHLSQALEQLNQSTFDVALLDLSLPDSQGLNVVTQIHSLYPDLPLIVLTGLDSETVALEAVRQGAQDYLIKGQLEQNLLVRSIRYAIERSQNQQIMRQQAAAIAAAQEGIAILNANYEYIYINQSYADLYGYSDPTFLLGKPWFLLSFQQESQPLAQEIRSALEKGNWLGESLGRKQDGSTFFQELSITSLKEGGYICLARDISDRKRSQIALRQALEKERELNQLKSKFVSLVSHEFRTPMAVIRTSADLLQRGREIFPAEKQDKYLEKIQTALDQMLELVDQVLLIANQESGGLTYQPIAFNIESFCHEIIEMIQFKAGSTYQINFLYQGNGNPVIADPVLCRHILDNLLSNAVKYSPKGGPIQVNLDSREEAIILKVRDWGIGISETDQQHLFEAFYRCSNVGSIPGTGLGLAIVKECVNLHRGQIQVESQLGQGTTFMIILPITEPVET